MRLRKGNILAASRLKRDANTDEGDLKEVIDAAEQKENLTPVAAGDFSSSNR